MADERPDLVPLGEAAERLDLSTEAVRKRIQRGTLVGEKVAGAWFVRADQLPPAPASLPSSGRPDVPVETASGRQDGADPTAGPGADGVQTGDQPPAGVDLMPLAELIERLTRANQDLAAAAAMWQERARVLEGRLLALGAGGAHRDPDPDADTPSAPPQAPHVTDPPRPPSEPLMLRWRRWRRRMVEGP